MRRLPYIMQPLLCAVADPIHCSEPHTPPAKIVTDRTLPRFGLLSVSECARIFGACSSGNQAHLHEYLLAVGNRNAPCRPQHPAARRKTVHDIAKSAFAIAGIRSSKAIPHRCHRSSALLKHGAPTACVNHVLPDNAEHAVAVEISLQCGLPNSRKIRHGAWLRAVGQWMFSPCCFKTCLRE